MVTRHADRRMRERLGVPRSAVRRVAERAMRDGMCREDFHGSLRRYLDALYYYNETANNIRVWAEKVYIFHDKSLITVLDLPKRYRNRANSAVKEKADG